MPKFVIGDYIIYANNNKEAIICNVVAFKNGFTDSHYVLRILNDTASDSTVIYTTYSVDRVARELTELEKLVYLEE